MNHIEHFYQSHHPDTLVVICTYANLRGEVHLERLWAERLEGDNYKLWSIPFASFGLEYHDIVCVNSENLISGITKKSSWCCYWVHYLSSDAARQYELQKEWIDEGAIFERHTPTMLACAVPEELFDDFEEYLLDLEGSGVINVSCPRLHGFTPPTEVIF